MLDSVECTRCASSKYGRAQCAHHSPQTGRHNHNCLRACLIHRSRGLPSAKRSLAMQHISRHGRTRTAAGGVSGLAGAGKE